MGGPEQHDAQVHSEVEDLEDLGVGECHHYDTSELGEGDAREYLVSSRALNDDQEHLCWQGGI